MPYGYHVVILEKISVICICSMRTTLIPGCPMKIRADLGMEKYIVGCYADMFSIDTRRRLNNVLFGQSIRNQVYFFNIFLFFRRQLLFWDYIMLRIEDLVAYYVLGQWTFVTSWKHFTNYIIHFQRIEQFWSTLLRGWTEWWRQFLATFEYDRSYDFDK